MVSRALAVVHTCIFDAWAAYDELAVGTRFRESLRRPSAERTDANKAEAISFAAYEAAVDLFPSRLPLFDELMGALGYRADVVGNATSPSGIGRLAAGAVLDHRRHDGSNQLGDLHPGAYSDYTGYTPVNTPDEIRDPNRWQPLRFSDGRGGTVTPGFLAPHWALVTPFALTSGSQFRSEVGPARLGSARYLSQAREILKLSSGLTDRAKVIAEYWADGPRSETPPGHWCLLAQDVSHRDGHGIDEDAKLYFAVTNAMFDAGIVAWDNKRFFDSARPITAIRYLFRDRKVRAWGGPGRGTRLIRGETWRPYHPDTFLSPPFPEYSSGHSNFSAAAAEVLACFTGSEHFGASATIPAGSSRIEPGIVPAEDVTLAWATFREAADEAGGSRRYGGIHFRQGDLDARATGRLAGAQAWAKARRYIDGVESLSAYSCVPAPGG